MNKYFFLFFTSIFAVIGAALSAQSLVFSNLTWETRDGFGGPGPNNWSSNNVWVDANGWLHLKITQINGVWYCPEIYTTTLLGFGQYRFYTIGRVDTLDPNVVLGLFNYPPPDVGSDGTNEIDIEFSKWGAASPTASNTFYTVWPAILKPNKTSLNYTMNLSGGYSTHGFTWKKNEIFYQSGHGHYDNYPYPILSWLFAPPDFENRIPQHPLPIHINLWLFQGKPPLDGQEVEIIIRKFSFTPL